MKKMMCMITVILMTVCTGCNKTVVMDLNRSEAEAKEIESISNDTIDPFQNFYSFYFNIDGNELRLHMTYHELLENGFSCNVDAAKAILASEGLPDVQFSNGKTSFIGTLQSKEDGYISAGELLLTKVIFTKESSPNSEIILPKNIKLNHSNKKYIMKEAGKPHDIIATEDLKESTWIYSYDLDEDISFIFDESKDIVTGISMWQAIEAEAFPI